jgi:hypothetical protein
VTDTNRSLTISTTEHEYVVSTLYQETVLHERPIMSIDYVIGLYQLEWTVSHDQASD